MRILLTLLAAAALAGAAKKSGPPPIDPNVERTIRSYVSDQLEEEGSFAVEDELLSKTWEAKLILVHTESLRRLPDGRVIACVDFKGEDAKNSQLLDLDFTVSGEGTDMTVEEVVIHKVGVKARFAYDAKHRRVPVKPGKAAGPKKSPAAPGTPGEPLDE
ncbi:MAG: hypothetical protein HYZ75_04315 [Elusimicrobia bacterium]|nr:hypothetical protein [Elusimicrobiota bacterium]